MALKLELETQFGTLAKYLNTQDIVISKKEGKVTVSLNGYVDEQARRNNASPVIAKGASFTIGAVKTGTEDRDGSSFVPFIEKDAIDELYKAVYEALKTCPEFADAEDV